MTPINNYTDMLAANLRAIGERLIKESKTLVGDDPSTSMIKIEITLECDTELMKVYDCTDVHIFKRQRL